MYDKNGAKMVRSPSLLPLSRFRAPRLRVAGTSADATSVCACHVQVDKEGGVGMEDAAGFFANVFGGERFKDYVSFFLPTFSFRPVAPARPSRLRPR